uniref:PIN-like domain-containing protein n=1 Tax=Xanthomonas sp. 0924 TaxID=2835534 RepID=UPI003F80A5FA
MKAQIDENLPPVLARTLNALVCLENHEVVHVSDYARGTPDVALFQLAIDRGITVHITQDHHQRRPLEREAIVRLGLTVFVLAKGWGGLNLYDKAARLIEYWPKIVFTANTFKAGSIFRVPPSRNGRFEQIKQR